MRGKAKSLSGSELGWRCPPHWIGAASTDAIELGQDASGQREAVGALRLGLRLRAPGYNVFVAGLPGTGRTSTARRIIAEEAAKGAVPDDLCYVFNFKDPLAPRCLRLPAGCGNKLGSGLEAAQERFRAGLAALRASGGHRRRRDAVSRKYRDQQSELLAKFEEEVTGQGFVLVEVNVEDYRRQELAPVVDDKPVAVDDLDNFVREGRIDAESAARLEAAYPNLMARLSEVTASLRAIGRELGRALMEADRDAAKPLVEETLEEIRAHLCIAEGGNEHVDDYLDEIRGFLLDVFPALYADGERLHEGGERNEPDPLSILDVNVLVDRSDEEGRPIIEEASPSPERLLGTLQLVRTEGGASGALQGLRAGALHRADGGFLLINAVDLISEEGGWSALKRALRSREVGFHLPRRRDESVPPLAPEAASHDVTIVLVGPPALRERLAEGDPEFDKLFKVVALFEERVELTRESALSYASFLAKVVKEEGLLPISGAAIARMLETMVREAGGRNKLSTRFRLLADLAREASLFAGEASEQEVGAEHVARALEERRHRSSVFSRRIFASIRDNVLHLEFEGQRVGQVNALAVVETSLERFGYPVRITGTCSMGRSGIIDIERESELSGEIHTKASLILAGYLRSLFAQRLPLTLTASLCFEQSYGGVDGDSASSAELVTLLSALSDVPLRQDIAITGAVDQRGQIMAVGGINEKVEGFWRACRSRGLVGTQGVAIPRANVDSLQVAPALVEDVEAGRFHVYAVETVQELMDLLCEEPFGTMDAAGVWTEGSLGARIARRLEEMAEVMRGFGAGSS